jgi:hypothetical protein
LIHGIGLYQTYIVEHIENARFIQAIRVAPLAAQIPVETVILIEMSHWFLGTGKVLFFDSPWRHLSDFFCLSVKVLYCSIFFLGWGRTATP